MQRIFSSLGSQYTTQDVYESFLQLFLSSRTAIKKLAEFLKVKYRATHVVLFYKGRDALECAVSVFIQPGDVVLTQAFACQAVEDAVLRAGGVPAYVDIGTETNCTVKTLERAYELNPTAKVLIVQHSLGIPADIEAICAWANKNTIFVIEDLAQSIGAVDIQGIGLGTHANAVVLSFGRDKVVDAGAGGAALFRSLTESQLSIYKKYMILPVPKSLTVAKDLLYPLFTLIIRKTHGILLGKVIHYFLKKIGVLSSPTFVSHAYAMTISSQHAYLALRKYGFLKQELQHRKFIAEIYYEYFSKVDHLNILHTQASILSGSNLRFVIQLPSEKKVTQVISFCQKKGIYIADRWYRQPVDSGEGGGKNTKTVYTEGSCVNAEERSRLILNLPTHAGISKFNALYIAEQVSEGLK